jgi:serine/threonine protein kinase
VLTSSSGVKITDFGLAKLGGLRGKRSEFTPPEWSPRDTLDPRSDLFSLGATLCNMASPEPHGSLNKSLQRVDSPHFQRILEKMIEPNPSHRVQSAEEVCRSLEDLSADLKGRTKRTTVAVTDHVASTPQGKSPKSGSSSPEEARTAKKSVSAEVGETRKSKTGKGKARSVNTWMEPIDDPLPVKRNCWYKFALNIGHTRKGLATPFHEPDFGKSAALDLLICLFSRDFKIERRQLVLTIPKEGESQVVDTKVRALRDGNCRIDILICLRKELELLQSLVANIDVESNIQAAAAVSA